MLPATSFLRLIIYSTQLEYFMMKKKILYCLVFLLPGLLLQAQQNQGIFKFKAIDPDNGNAYFLVLYPRNGTITGTYSEQQNPDATYSIKATLVDNKIKGRMTDKSGIFSFKITCTFATKAGEDGLYLTLDNPLYVLLVPRLFFKAYADSDRGDRLPGAVGTANGFDKELIGKWTSTTFYSSGEFRSTARQTMIINSNATLTLYESEVNAR